MYVMPFSEIRKEMFEECGGKGAHLGEMTCLGLNVPPGFVVLENAFYTHLSENRIEGPIAALAEAIDFDDYDDLEGRTAQIRRLIEEAPVPVDIGEEVAGKYRWLSGTEDRFVAVRSSVAIKDSPISSFPGLMDTFHYLRGERTIVDHVRRCWASVWSARAAFGRHQKQLDHWKAVIAPVVQLMVDSEKAGVAFTINPLNGNRDEVVIESIWGLGEGVVSGRCLCDLYVARKHPFEVISTKIANKEQAYVQKPDGGAEWVAVEPGKANRPTLTDEEVEEISSVACRVEEHYGYPQDLEWAFEGGELFMLQTRRAKTAGE